MKKRLGGKLLRGFLVTQQEFFLKILKVLEDKNIPYMISGSVGSMIYGAPRMTNDINIVVELHPEQIGTLMNSFSEEEYYYPSVDFIKKVINEKSQFNIIHLESGSKADLIIKKDTEFAEAEFSRRKSIPFTENFQASSASAEDIIISKIAFYELGKSEKHISDILSILKISEKEIDLKYIEDWIKRLQFQETWNHIQTKTD